MAIIKLPYNERIEVPTNLAKQIKLAKEQGKKPDTPIKISETRTITLGQIKDVDTSGRMQTDQRFEEGMDIFRNRETLMKFAREVEIDGGFDAYLRQKQLLIPSQICEGMMVINVDRHVRYTDALMKWDLVKKIWDMSITNEERQEGMAVLREILQKSKLLKQKISV